MAHGSCCCCCLHSVAGIAGAVWGSLRRNAPDPDTLTTPEAVRAEEEIKTAHRLAVKVYWLSLTIIASIALAILAIGIRQDEPLLGPFLVLFFLPGGQLLASLVTVIWLVARPPASSECFRRLGKITLFGFLGALVGIVGVVITFVTMRWAR